MDNFYILPPNWTWTRICDVGQVITGTTPSKKEPSNYGSYMPFVKPPELQNSVISSAEDNLSERGVKYARVLPVNSVLVSCIGNLGKTAINKIPVASNQQINAIVFSDKVFPKFGFYYFQTETIKNWLYEQASATTVTIINKSKFEKAPFVLPPFRDQERIVAKIEELFSDLDAATASLQRARANLKRYRQSVLQAAVTGELTRDWRTAHRAELEPAGELLKRIQADRRARWEADLRSKGKDPAKIKYEEPKGPDVSRLPEGWEWVTVEQIANQRLGKMLDKEKNKGKPCPYLRNANVRWFGFDLSDIHEMRVTDEEMDDISVKAGDLVVCEGGEPGRAAVWENTGETAVIQKAIHRVRMEEGVLPWYLAYCLAADANSGRLESYFTGSTIKHLTGESLRSYKFSLAPKAEQNYIVDEIEQRLSISREQEIMFAINIQRVDRLRQSILRLAFSGQLFYRE